MTNRELQRLSRRELLELLLKQQQKNEQLKKRVSELEEELNDREVEFGEIGSLAEASLAMSNVFEAADKAVEIYKENIRRCSEEQKIVYDRVVRAAERKAAEIIRSAEDEKRRRVLEMYSAKSKGPEQRKE